MPLNTAREQKKIFLWVLGGHPNPRLLSSGRDAIRQIQKCLDKRMNSEGDRNVSMQRRRLKIRRRSYGPWHPLPSEEEGQPLLTPVDSRLS